MKQFETQYANLVSYVLSVGAMRKTRNGYTKSVFGVDITWFDLEQEFPLLLGREVLYKGVLGEFAAMVRGPKDVYDFKKFGCNYWDKFADPETGALNVDYGNAWLQPVDQIDWLIETIKKDPTNRRLIINSWRPENLANLTLPCCHYSYQFYVNNDKLELLWIQRSSDLMIGVPSDAILAALMVLTIAKETGLRPGAIKMSLGDCHIYEEHVDQAKQYLMNTIVAEQTPIEYEYVGDGMKSFIPEDIIIRQYKPHGKLQFKLKV
jgi:thymidylate synthase